MKMMLFDGVRKPLGGEPIFCGVRLFEEKETSGRKGSLRYELFSMLGMVLGATVCEHSRQWSVRLLLLRRLPASLL
jgi:hypothetical protein